MRGLLACLVALLALPGLSSCSSNDDAEPVTGPRLERVECPDDVEIQVVPSHSCGFVVTTSSSGAALRIFVVTVEPPEPTDLAPVLETGTDLGLTPTYGGLAPIAQRTGRRLVMIDLPGVGHSTPSLDCPETESLVLQPTEEQLLAAVAACRTRLNADGVTGDDLTAGTLGEVLYDVTTAMAEPRWVVMGHGSSGVGALDLAAQHPEVVEALVLDSVLSHDPEPTRTLDGLVAEIGAQCRAVPTCLDTYGDPSQNWVRAHERLSVQPLEVAVGQQTLSIDRAGLDRVVRWLVAPAVHGPQLLPALLSELALGKPGRLVSLYAGTVSVAPPLCVGYLPRCESNDRIATGAVLSTVCPSAAEDPDWRNACRAWGVQREETRRTQVRGIPVLALFGALDPFASPELIRTALAEAVPEARVVEFETLAHNVLGDDCVRSLRNDWLAGPLDAQPAIPTCLPQSIAFDPGVTP